MHLKLMLVILSIEMEKIHLHWLFEHKFSLFSGQYLHHHDAVKVFDMQTDSLYKEFTEDLTIVIEYKYY